uniref:Cyclin dependent kinase 2 interacting protein n=1 Tax=Latimeria chalumnae TaxID=7897 RepID=H3A9L2_LATCH
YLGKSPGFLTPKRPVLKISASKIKDSAADWHNFTLKWENWNESGFTVANKIVNIKLSRQTESDKKLEMEYDGVNLNLKPKQSDYNKELEGCCNELISTLENMAKLELKMQKLTSTIKGICDLEAYHHGKMGSEVPLFHTWVTTYFYEVSSKLSEMFKKELQLKQTIVQEIAHTDDRDLMMVYLSSWLYQPYIEENYKLLLESMLLETGHRPL